MSTIKFTQKGSPAHWAHHYTARLGLALVPIPHGLKGPRAPGWNDPANTVTDPHAAADLWQSGQNMGVLHSASGTASLDVDHQEWATEALAAIGIDLPALQTGLMIRGKANAKPLYRLPDGVTFDRRSLAWPHPTDRTPQGRPKNVTVFELRAGAVQDVLPPSIHPDTNRPYEWVGTPPRSRDDIPELPPELLDLWTNWEYYLEFLRDACPWATEAPVTPEQTRPRPETPYSGPQRPGDAFRERVGIRDVLERNGYKRKGERYLPPDSQTKVAGVRILIGDDGVSRAFSDHGSCALNDGHAHDSFSAFVLLEHHGNVTAAVKAAAAELGMTRPASVAETPRPPQVTLEQVKANWEAAENELQIRGGSLLDNMQGNARVKNALIELWMTLTHIAPTHIREWDGAFVLDYGGLVRLKAYGVTGHNKDITARLRQLADLGYFTRIIKSNPGDQTSPVYLQIPADPHALPMMKLTQEESKRLSVKSRDRPERNTKTGLILPNKKKARPKGIGEDKAYFDLAASRLTVLYLACQPGCKVSELAQLRNKQPQAIQRQVRRLVQEGIVTRSGHSLTLNMTWPEFLAHLRLERENDSTIRFKVLRALERSEANARRRVFGQGARACPPRELAKRKRVWNLLTDRLERVRAGESLSEVLGLVA